MRSNFDPASADCRRLFHGRGGCYPGLEGICVDWFPPVAVVAVYGTSLDPVLEELVAGLRQVLAEQLSCLLLQRRHRPDAPWQVLFGALPEAPLALEQGLRYHLRLGTSQNLGFFPDMGVGRTLVRGLARGRRVLNLFAYTCSFSVAALAGGASQVVNLDMNRGALEVGKQNHRENGLDLRRASFLAHDLFRSFGKLRRLGPFDLVVVDPPSHQGASFSALRDWPRLVRRLPPTLAPGAHIVACLNSPHLGPAFIEDLFHGEVPEAQLLARLGADLDEFPDREAHRALKIFHYRLG